MPENPRPHAAHAYPGAVSHRFAPPRGRGLARVSTWLALAGLALAAVGAWLWFRDPSPAQREPGEDVAASSASPPVSPSASPSASTSPAVAVRAAWKPGAPRRVVIPSLDVDAPVVPIKAPDGTLIPPADPQQLGWWSDGARPGDRGSVLVTGHTVHTGGGALDDLETVERGDPVTVRTVTGDRRYVVKKVRVYSKGTVAQDAQRLFSQDVPGRLVLVTCEDWNGVQYLSNVVVVAKPLGAG